MREGGRKELGDGGKIRGREDLVRKGRGFGGRKQKEERRDEEGKEVKDTKKDKY